MHSPLPITALSSPYTRLSTSLPYSKLLSSLLSGDKDQSSCPGARCSLRAGANSSAIVLVWCAYGPEFNSSTAKGKTLCLEWWTWPLLFYFYFSLARLWCFQLTPHPSHPVSSSDASSILRSLFLSVNFWDKSPVFSFIHTEITNVLLFALRLRVPCP